MTASNKVSSILAMYIRVSTLVRKTCLGRQCSMIAAHRSKATLVAGL